MSVTIMARVWPMDDLSTTDKMVLIALADAANDDGVTWIAVTSKKRDEKLDLRRKTGLSERALQGAIKRLGAAGHLTRTEVPGKGCTYHVHPRTTCAPAQDAPPQQTTPTPAPPAGKPSITVIPSSKAAHGRWHRLPANWEPARALPPALVAKVDQWPPGKLDDTLAAFRGWAANAADSNGKGRKLDWDQAWHNWLRGTNDDRAPRSSTNRPGTHRRTAGDLLNDLRMARMGGRGG